LCWPIGRTRGTQRLPKGLLLDSGHIGDAMGFRDALKNENPQLAKYVKKYVVEVGRELDGVQRFFSEYTDHSVKHSERVLALAERLVVRKTSVFEKALLILFAYYHDWGMVVSDEEYTDYANSLGDDAAVRMLAENACGRAQVQNLDPSRGRLFLALEHFRQEHAVRSARMIRQRFPQECSGSLFDGGIYLWETLATICQAHQRDIAEILRDPSVSCTTFLGRGVTVDAVFLIAVSRIADACHFARDRALPFLRPRNPFESGRSEDIWSYYANVSDTLPNSKTHRIEVQAKCKNFYIHRAIVNDAHQIQAELVNVHRLLAEQHCDRPFDWKYVDTSAVVPANSDYDYHDSRFTLSHQHIITLLMGDRLYPGILYALRECIQNAVDAVTVYGGKAATGYPPCIVVDVSQAGIVDIYDNGTGMDKEIVDKHFLSVGESAFWYSDRGIKEWGGARRNTSLIAEHGIGTLSYFMLAAQVEIFSIYGQPGQHLHVVLDDYLDGVVFKNTPLSEFPRFEGVQTTTPWELGHGTLIRMRLKQSADPVEVLRFLRRHILRISCALILRTPEGSLAMPAIWHLRRADDSPLYDLPGQDPPTFESGGTPPSIADVFKDLYTPRKDFYENPPSDRALVDNEYGVGKTHYRVRLAADSGPNEQFRLSQNGIVVEDAGSFFRGIKGDLPLMHTFTVDVEVRDRCFQLTANRTQISDNGHNRQLAQELMRAFVESYFEQVAKIEAAVYFPCGGHYYHGMADVLSGAESLQVCFHQSLRRFFQDQEANRHWVVEHEQQFVNAHLYCVGTSGNRPISVREMEEDSSVQEVLVLQKPLTESRRTIRKTGGRMSARLSKFMEAVGSHASSLETLVYIPGDRDAFVLPLTLCFRLSVKYENENFRLLRIDRSREFDPGESLRLLTSE
jgi:hypothetical protein